LNSYGLTPTTPSRWRVYLIPPPRHSPPTKSRILRVTSSGRGGRTRTRDLRFWRPLLFQLSYTPIYNLDFKSTPGAIRTPDTRFRKPLLYPSELQGQQAKITIVPS
jgi:hypothetical protein